MTKINQAFIKAYRHDEAQAAPGVTGGAPVKPPLGPPVRAEALAGSHTRTAAATGERSALYGPRSSQTPSTTAVSTRRAGPAAEKQPLSSYIGGTGIGVRRVDKADADFFRPGTTIASFQWPAVCRVLAQQCATQLDHVADLLIAQAEAGRSLIGVIGLFTGRGATTTALCLAARLASRGRRIILVDGNFCRPSLATWLEAVPTAGWQDVLKRGAPLADAVVRATDNHLDLLGLGPKPPADALRLVAGLQAVVTAGVLRHAYDLVLIDAGAFFDSTSQPIVVELARNMGVDAVLAVAGPEPADARDLATVAAHLGQSGCELLGTIENRCNGQESRVESREPERSSGS